MNMTEPETTSPKLGPVFWIGGPIVALCFIVAVGGWLSAPADPATVAAEKHWAELEAVRDTCEGAIRMYSINAKAAVVPKPDIVDNGDTWRAIWVYNNRAQLQNQFGAMIDAPVQCSVRKDNGKIDELLIAGEKII
jgi:hypothetical protein